MAIDDPTAIPQTPEHVAEYMQEADRLWNDNRTEEAHTLYRSVYSATGKGADSSLACYRVALYLQTTGDTNGALLWSELSSEPATQDLRIALRAAMPDQAVDPSEVPQTTEACDHYAWSMINFFDQGDWATVDAIGSALMQTTVDYPISHQAIYQTYRGVALVHLGRNDEARPILEFVVANCANQDRLAQARAALQQIGIEVQDGGNPYDTPDSHELLAGIAAFERGDEQAAMTSLRSVVNSGNAGETDKGRAHFYLGSMDYHTHRFDEARTHLHTAEKDAPDPEKGWATDMLSWRWQEE
jgi:tetratricopeptide (TPR) repeat protein